jgi:hypothetical protein
VRRAFLLLVLTTVPGIARAQSSQFGIRGLGFPGRALSTHAIASGGAFGLFDAESSLNPAALIGVSTVTAVFTGSESFRHEENPAGTGSVRDTRFPHFMVVGPARQGRAALGLSYSNYTSRDFTIASTGTIDLRGVPVPVSDSLLARGGLNDLRVGGAVRLQGWTVGLGLHVISGSNRLVSRRVFPDTLPYLSSRQQSELSYAGAGLSVGLMRQFGQNFGVAAIARSDGHLNKDRDSTRIGTVDLPYTFGLGMHWRPSPQLDLAGQALVRTWSAANSDLLAQGGLGAENTFEVAAGAEFTPDPKRPYRRPLRLGAHYARLPFPLVPDVQGHEFGVSAGSGLRFAQQRAGVDLAVEHVWRSEGPYSERGFILSLGITVRP